MPTVHILNEGELFVILMYSDDGQGVGHEVSHLEPKTISEAVY